MFSVFSISIRMYPFEKCQAHLGMGRDMEWEKKYHLTPQIVYLALTANAKVGVTRKPQIPTRWLTKVLYRLSY